MCAYVLPWVLSGKSGYIRIHDGLDSLMSWYTIMKHQGFWFTDNLELVGPIFENGAPRISYPNELSIISVLFGLLEPYWAYVAYQLIFRLAALSGMYMLLQTFINRDQSSHRTIVFGVSLCYALLPYFTWAAGPAVLAWIAYVLARSWRNLFGPLDFLVLLIAPLFTAFQFTGFFVVATALLLIPLAYALDKLNWRLVGAVVLVSVSHIAIDYRLFEFILLNGFETHRVDFVLGNTTLGNAIESLFDDLKNGSSHAPSLHYFLIMPVAGIALLNWALKPKWLSTLLAGNRPIIVRRWFKIGAVILGLLVLLWVMMHLPNMVLLEKQIKGIARHIKVFINFIPILLWMAGMAVAFLVIFKWFSTDRHLRKDSHQSLEPHPLENCSLAVLALLLSSGLILIISIFYGLWVWSGLDFIRDAIPIFKQFNPTRINFLRPFAWMLVFALSLLVLLRQGRLPLRILLTLLAIQISLELAHHEFLTSKKNEGISFSQFMAEDQFNAIEQAIGAPKASYVVGSIGLHPSIAQYNGFRTADAYFSLYPKSYKTRFRKVVFEEFSRLPELLRYFDEWGSRAYFFSSEMTCPRNGSICTKKIAVSIDRLELNMAAMKSLGVGYLLSVATIGNAAELGLKSIGTFEDEHSAWSVTVYKIE